MSSAEYSPTELTLHGLFNPDAFAVDQMMSLHELAIRAEQDADGPSDFIVALIARVQAFNCAVRYGDRAAMGAADRTRRALADVDQREADAALKRAEMVSREHDLTRLSDRDRREDVDARTKELELHEREIRVEYAATRIQLEIDELRQRAQGEAVKGGAMEDKP